VSQADLRELYQPVGAEPHPETFAERRQRRQQTQRTLERFGLLHNGPG
jgi:hypothetical protein